MSDIMLETKGLSCGYGDGYVLKDISFSLSRGTVLGIIGPNGSGKTTLFRAMGGTLPRLEGNIFYLGRDIFGIPVKERAKTIAFIPQFFTVPFQYTVEQVVLMGRYPHRKRFEPFSEEDRKILAEVLEETDLAGCRSSMMNSLSGGEMQRAVLAQGLCQQPDLLLLDEPTSHLDIGHQTQILDLIRRLRDRRGLTVAVILHDLNLASLYCDELMLLHRGELYKKGSVEDVLTYENIEKVYGATVVVKQNPVTKKPSIFAIPERYKHVSR
jgi:iron complex transport system ATP-binding protein